MKTNTYIRKIKHNPSVTLGGGAIIENKHTGEVCDVFKSGVSASKFWIKAYKRNPDLRVIPKASLFDYLSEKKVLRGVWSV